VDHPSRLAAKCGEHLRMTAVLLAISDEAVPNGKNAALKR
jgi:hypothetical protein